MSDPSQYDPNAQPDPNESPNVRQMREHIKNLEAQAKEGTEAKGRVEQLERQLVVRDAGLNLDPKQLKALQAVHEGDWTPEAVKATAGELGFGQAPPAPQNQPTPEELAALTRINQATSGGTPVPPADPGDTSARLRAFVAEGHSEREFDAFVKELGISTGTLGGPKDSGGIQQL